MLRTLRKWCHEIRAVGLRDWWFYVVELHRNEFSPKLGLYSRRYQIDRLRAHRVDLILGDQAQDIEEESDGLNT